MRHAVDGEGRAKVREAANGQAAPHVYVIEDRHRRAQPHRSVDSQGRAEAAEGAHRGRGPERDEVQDLRKSGERVSTRGSSYSLALTQRSQKWYSQDKYNQMLRTRIQSNVKDAVHTNSKLWARALSVTAMEDPSCDSP